MKALDEFNRKIIQQENYSMEKLAIFVTDRYSNALLLGNELFLSKNLIIVII